MKFPIILLIAALATLHSFGQENKDTTVYQFVSQMPQPSYDMKKYLAENIKYPNTARKNGIEGKVAVQYTVNEDGSLSNFRIVRGIGNGCDEEALRVMKLMPPWIPGKKDGKPVRVRYTQPITFRIR